ncbi:MAG: protein kinase [Coleofasciculus sp. Co-bin14]|nr:protein kinase [Coleofasciculus sp. Co-bin14]
MLNTEANEPVLGTFLNGRYKLVQILSGGAFGQTYIAQDSWRIHNPPCAVKHLEPKGNDPRRWQHCERRFIREAEILKKLGDHFQIPQLLDSLEDKHGFYLVQELIVGELLSAELPTSRHCAKRWSEQECVQLLDDVLGILEFIHSQGIVHGDLKPNNLIRRTFDRRVVLIDFGAAQELSPTPVKPKVIPLKRFKAPVGIQPLGYQSPEQLNGLIYPNSDLYALGMIVIEALTGLNPSQLEADPNTGEVNWQQVPVSDPMMCLLDRMVRYDFKDRYQSASDARIVLKRLMTASEEQTVRNEEFSEQFISYSSSGLPPSNPLTDTEELEPCLHTVPLSNNRSTPEPAMPTNSSMLVDGSDRASPITSAELVASSAGGPEVTIADNTSSDKWYHAREIAMACCPKLPPLMTGVGAGMATSNALAISFGLYTLLYVNAANPGGDVLAKATEKYKAGDFDEALALAKSIPTNSSAYQESLRVMQQWRTEWNTGATQFKAVEEAFNEGRWKDVLKEARKTPNIVAWQQKIKPFVEQAKPQLEKEAQKLVQKAYKQASQRDFTGAIASLKQISPDTPTGAKIQPKLTEYKQKQQVKADHLLIQAYEQASKRNFSSALKYLSQVPEDTPAYNKAQAKIGEYSMKQALKEEVQRQAELNARLAKEQLKVTKVTQRSKPSKPKASRNLNPGNQLQEVSPQKVLPTTRQ